MSDAARPEDQGLPAGLTDHLDPPAGWERDLETYRQMLTQANQAMNLVGASTLGQFWSRHFVDSAQLLALSPKTRVWADLGSGAGLPGLVLAILLKGDATARVHLVESMAKRCRFLSSVVEALALPAVVHNARAESLDLRVEVVTARACAPLDRLLGYAQPFFDRGARGLFLKGGDVDAEIVEARKNWRFEASVRCSVSDPRGRVLSIEELKRVRRR